MPWSSITAAMTLTSFPEWVAIAKRVPIVRMAGFVLALVSTLATASYVEISDCADSARRQLVPGTQNGVLISNSGASVAVLLTNLDEKKNEVTFEWRFRSAPSEAIQTGTGRIALDSELAVTKVADFIVLWRVGKTSPALLYCPARAAAQLFPKSRFREMP